MTDLFNSNKIFYITLGNDGRYTLANNCFRRRFSFLPGLEDAGLLQIVFPADVPLYKDATNTCMAGVAKKRNALLRMLRGDGNYCAVEWEFFTRFDEAGNIAGISALGFETAHADFNYLGLEMQLRSLRALSDNSSDGILLLNKDYKIVSYNKPAENLSFEMYKRQYTMGDDFRNYVREEARVYFYRQFDKALKGIITEEVFELEKKAGKQIFLKVQMTPVYDEREDEVSGVAVITKDVTLMQNLNKRLDEVTAMQSHQIRRPVANMLSLVDLMDSGNLTEEQKEYLGLLKISIGQLEQEIHNIVKTARAI